MERGKMHLERKTNIGEERTVLKKWRENLNLGQGLNWSKGPTLADAACMQKRQHAET